MVHSTKFFSLKNKCNSINKKARRHYLKETIKDDNLSNKNFWKTLNSFLIKGCQSTDFMTTEEDGELINSEQTLV